MVSIKVEEPQDESGRKDDLSWVPWLKASGQAALSTRAPTQSLVIFYLSSLIPPLLAAILEATDFSSSSQTTLYHLRALIELISISKPDAYLDVLEVVGYHTSKARRAALSILMTVWPKALGHVTITQPLTILRMNEPPDAQNTMPVQLRPFEHHPYSHQFVPWYFSSPSSPAITHHHGCQSCSKPIHGFGLFCPFCLCAVHFDCYDHPSGSVLSQHILVEDDTLHKVAVHRFSHILPYRTDEVPVIDRTERHKFRPVNVFTLTLCFVCHQPLWGCVNQGQKCASCHQFVHNSCISSDSEHTLPRCHTIALDTSHLTIQWDALRLSFAKFYESMFISQEELPHRSYEEVRFLLVHNQLQLKL